MKLMKRIKRVLIRLSVVLSVLWMGFGIIQALEKGKLNLEAIFSVGILPIAIGWASLYTLFWVLAGFESNEDEGPY